jgi:hypothetical protein
MTLAAVRPLASDTRNPPALTELFSGGFRRDLLAFFPQALFESVSGEPAPEGRAGPPNFCLREPPGGAALEIELFGALYRISDRRGTPFTPQDRRMMRAIGAVLVMRYHHLFQISSTLRHELYRGGSEDHYVAAFLEPSTYEPAASRPSRIAATIQALRIAALSTYENHRVSTGALLLGSLEDPSHSPAPAAPDALPYGVELTGLKSVHRLCDGKRTLFLVDRAGFLADIIDIARWADETPRFEGPEVPCARAYQAHARATSAGGHTCLVLSPNQEIKIFSGGSQVFTFAHGRWRILDPQARYAHWEAAVAQPELAQMLFQAALNLAEMRQGGLFVVVSDPAAVRGGLIAPHDLLSSTVQNGPPPELTPRDPLAKRALHYLARGRNATALEPTVLEALASLDGALVTDRTGRLLAFGAILRHDTSDLPVLTAAEGARTAAACVASRFGPVLKVSEDGVVSCYLNGARAWDL